MMIAGKGKEGLFEMMYPLMVPGPELDAMQRRATTFVRRHVQDDEHAAQVLEALGLDGWADDHH